MQRYRLKPQRAPKLTENDVERACLDFLHLRGYKEHRLHCGRARFPDGTWTQLEPVGTPDWLLVHSTHPAFYLETKRPGAELAPGQILKHLELTRGLRLHVSVASSVEELRAWLDEHEAQISTRV